VLLDADHGDDALAALQLSGRLGEERGNVMWLPLHHAMLGLHRAVGGELTDAVAEAEAGLVLADEVGTRLHAPLLHGVAAWVALQRGDIAAGEARMVDAREEFVASVSQDWQLTTVVGGVRMASPRWPLEWGLWIQALLSEARGNTGQARVLLEEAWELATPLRFCLSYRLLGPDLVRLAIAVGDRERAAAVADEVADGATRSRIPSAAGAALRCRGLADDDPAVLLAAVQTYRQVSQTVELPLACEDAGAALCRAGRTAEAIPVLEDALDFYLRTGAQRGCPGGRGAASPRHPAPAGGPSGQTVDGVGKLDRQRARRRTAGCRGSDQPPDRRPAVHLLPDGRNPSGPRVPKIGDQQPGSTGRRSNPQNLITPPRTAISIHVAVQTQPTRAISIHVARDSGEGLEEACFPGPGGCSAADEPLVAQPSVKA
jgi:hypothetical protein